MTQPQQQIRTNRLVVGLAILVIFSAIYFRFSTDKPNEKIEPIAPEVIASSAIQHEIDLTKEISWADGKTPVLIYRDEISSTNTAERGYPTIKIWRKIGSEPYEELATVGKVGEYPIEVTLSQDKKSLLVNLESKLQLLDLETKELRDIFVPEKSTYLGAVFSPDNKYLFIWDQFYAEPEDNQYFVHKLNLETLEDVVLVSGEDKEVYSPTLWREDGKIIVAQLMGEFANSWYFDLEKNSLVQIKGGPMAGHVSADGKSMSVVNAFVGNICNEFSGDAWSGYKIIDPVSGIVQGGLRQQGKPAGIGAFSPDGKQIIYSVSENIVSKEQCDVQPKPPTYYQSNYDGSGRKKLTHDQYMGLANEWGYDSIGAEIDYDYEKNTYTISVNEKPIVSSSKDLRIVAQYLK